MHTKQIHLCEAVHFIKEVRQTLTATPRLGSHHDTKRVVKVAFQLVEFSLRLWLQIIMHAR